MNIAAPLKAIREFNLANFIFNEKNNFAVLRWGEGVIIGAIAMIFIGATIPPKIEEVEVVKVVEKPVVVKEPVYLNKYDKQQIQCMATNTYFEAGFEPKQGKIAVNNVVMNRVNDKRFPQTPCGVINQKARGVCQFSWKCEGGKRITDWAAYRRAKEVAEHVYLGNYQDVTGGAKFYHADYVRPSWSNVFDRTTKIGAHIFYRG